MNILININISEKCLILAVGDCKSLNETLSMNHSDIRFGNSSSNIIIII